MIDDAVRLGWRLPQPAQRWSRPYRTDDLFRVQVGSGGVCCAGKSPYHHQRMVTNSSAELG
jgi:hypothetical protein